MQKFTVWIVQSNGRGTHHVSTHEAETPWDAAQLAITETISNWGDAWADQLHVLGICKGDVEILEWDESVFGEG